MTTIAVIMACHNRRAQTLKCLAALSGQQLQAPVRIRCYLLDDGSTDGTAEEVRVQFPHTVILQGSGASYWNGGMRQAIAAAMEIGHEFYLLVNDDTRLEETAIPRLLKTYSELESAGYPTPIVIGSTRDEQTGLQTYGGMERVGSFRTKFRLVPPDDKVPKPCDTFNANCVLLSAKVMARVGNLSSAFTHSMGDFDYGLRARAAGFTVWVVPGFIGSCSRNRMAGRWRDGTLPFRVRWRLLMSPKGLPPREWLTFSRRHALHVWPVTFVSPYIRCILAGWMSGDDQRGIDS